jgi:hypothetical protein
VGVRLQSNMQTRTPRFGLPDVTGHLIHGLINDAVYLFSHETDEDVTPPLAPDAYSPTGG